MDAAERQRAGDQENYYCAGGQAIEFLHGCNYLEFPEREGGSQRTRSAIEFWLFGRDVLIGIGLVGGI